MNAARMIIFLTDLVRKAQVGQRFYLAGENSFCRRLLMAIRIWLSYQQGLMRMRMTRLAG